MIRADLSSLPDYVPGVRSEGALKLSSNESTHGPLPHAVLAMQAATTKMNRYPDMSAAALIDALAAHLDLPADQVAVGCGSSALCQQLVQITCLNTDDEVIFPWRSFEGYPLFVQVAGATPVRVPLTADHRLDLPAMANALTPKTRLIFICNPNNPTGTTVTKAEFETFMQAVPSDVLVAVDEAYFEFLRTDDTPLAHELIHRYENVVGLRTFSKAYALAGIRVGYAFGAPSIIKALKKVAIPFSVNAIAQAAAIASIEASEAIAERTDEVVFQRDRVAHALGAVPSQGNYVWLPDMPDSVAAKLAEQGILVRNFPEGIRITVTTATEMNHLLHIWETIQD